MSTDASATASEADAILAVSLEGARAFGNSWAVVLLLIPHRSAQAAAAVDCANGKAFPSQHGIEQAMTRAQSGAIAAAKTSIVAANSARRSGALDAGAVPGLMEFVVIARDPKSNIGPGRIPLHVRDHHLL